MVLTTVKLPKKDKDTKTQQNFWEDFYKLKNKTKTDLSKSFFSWFIGGLNYQIEHHLFPNICHVHYHEISKIVKETAKEYNLPYHSNNTFISALRHHFNHLKLMGRA